MRNLLSESCRDRRYLEVFGWESEECAHMEPMETGNTKYLKGLFLMDKKEENIQQTIYQYCIDCKRPTEQTYHHTNTVDGDLVYVCNECGCENSYDEE